MKWPTLKIVERRNQTIAGRHPQAKGNSGRGMNISSLSLRKVIYIVTWETNCH
jgi:hypothetical protein